MTAMLSPPKFWTFDEFMSIPDSVGYELVNGNLIERKPMGALSDYVAQQISFELVSFCRISLAGHVFGAETTYRCFNRPNTGRRADVSFIHRGRLAGEKIPVGAIEIPADLAVEVISPSDTAYEVREKIALYLRHDFGEVWEVYPNVRIAYIHRPGATTLVIQGDQPIVGVGPLAGFSCPVSSFFPPVQPKENEKDDAKDEEQADADAEGKR